MKAKAEWHWKCRWFNHKYFRRSVAAGVSYGPYQRCTRCGFDPGL